MNILYVANSSADGLTNIESRSGVVSTNRLTGNDTLNRLSNTIAHEIGHVMLGAGHPDQVRRERIQGVEVWVDGGVAPLRGVDPTNRLMCSGLRRNKDLDPRLLVKREWNEAEKWLKDNPDRRETNQQ